MDSPFKMDYLLDVDAAYRLFYSQGAQGHFAPRLDGTKNTDDALIFTN